MPKQRAVEYIKHCSDLLAEVRKCTKVLPGNRVLFTSASCESVFDQFRECVVRSFVSAEEVEKASRAVKTLVDLLEEVVKEIGGRGWLLPRETGDFVKNPVEHLKKKVLLYTYDLLRRKISIEEYASKAKSAINSSMRSNMRTVYEVWVLSSILKHSLKYGSRIVYPEHGFVHFDRHGKQKSGTMPPNIVIEVPGKGMLSFYLEAPRPLGWRDFKDLKQVWKFYTSLRPDVMVYPGLVLDIVDLSSSDIPILKPEVVIECKELEDWFVKARELKGPVNPSLSFDEWFKRWLSGLWSGLADVLGISSSVAREFVEGKRRGVRVTEVQLVKVYKSVYKPRKFYLVSAPKLPGHVKKELEYEGIAVFDGVKVGCVDCLEGLAEEVLSYAKPVSSESLLSDVRALKQALAQLGLSLDEYSVTRLALKFALKKISEFAEAAKSELAAEA